MKWIEIAKAKPKFNLRYLVTDGEAVEVSFLESSVTKSNGILHTFNGPNVALPTHIALITLPNQKEVTNG